MGMSVGVALMLALLVFCRHRTRAAAIAVVATPLLVLSLFTALTAPVSHALFPPATVVRLGDDGLFRREPLGEDVEFFGTRCEVRWQPECCARIVWPNGGGYVHDECGSARSLRVTDGVPEWRGSDGRYHPAGWRRM